MTLARDTYAASQMKPNNAALRKAAKAGLAAFIFVAGSAQMALAVPVTVEVNWPNWSSDNRVIIRDPSGTTLATICDPTNCYNSAVDSNYSNTFNYDFPAGTNYSIQMDDAWGDAWNGTNPYVRIFSDGVLVLNDDGPPNTTETLNFDVASAPTAPPVIPVLNCPVGQAHIMDWANESWTQGALTHAPFDVDGTSISVSLTDTNNWFINNPVSGGATPQISTTLTGGVTPAEANLLVVANPSNQTNITTFTLSLGDPNVGVERFQTSLFDVDFGASQFEDYITVNGSLGGTAVTPTLTAGLSNVVTGNIARGTGASNPDSSNGNLTINFDAPVDTVTISYRAGPLSPADPGSLGIGLHDLKFCRSPKLEASKTVSVYDPSATGTVYALPGNDVIYTISVDNIGTGDADTDSMELIDRLPPEIEIWNGDIDDGGPETDPVSFSQTGGGGLTFNYATDVRFGTGPTKPADFDSCTTVAPDSSYRPDLTFICFNPKGAMAAGDPDPSFSVNFRARIK